MYENLNVGIECPFVFDVLLIQLAVYSCVLILVKKVRWFLVVEDKQIKEKLEVLILVQHQWCLPASCSKMIVSLSLMKLYTAK